MPPEWAPHARCWMAWPCRPQTFGGALEDARRAFAAVAQAIARFEPVTMVVRPEDVAMVSLYCGSGVTVLPLAQDDSWARDTGPTFLVDGKGNLAGVDWTFNGWGELMPDHSQDAQMARRILDHVGAERYASPLVTEGGNIHVDGEGTCLVCTSSLLDPKRNPGMSQAEAEAELMRCLGVDKVVWLPGHVADDETGGHIDNIACFARPGVVLALATDDPSSPDHASLAANLEVLRSSTDARGRTLEVVTVPQPKPRLRPDGRRMSLSYINFYPANGALIVPRFADAADSTAARTLSTAFPGREIVPVDALDIVQGGGGIHCITQQQPVA